MFKLFGSNASNENISLELTLTRDSVAAGDDVDAPHEKILRIKIEPTWSSVFNAILEQRYLPNIDSGNATWVGVSQEPLVVIAQQWKWQARRLWNEQAARDLLPEGQGQLRVHFSYLAQLDPEITFQVLSRCKFNAMKMNQKL